MTIRRYFATITAVFTIFGVASCGSIGSGPGSIGSGGGGGSIGSGSLSRSGEQADQQNLPDSDQKYERRDRGSIFDLFENRDDPNVTLEVNKYIWRASLEVLNFLPLQSADPFSGLIVTGYGTPPGGGAAYRATIYVTDPALDARSLKLSLQRQGGRAVDADTVRLVEDAILTRARQLRQADSRL